MTNNKKKTHKKIEFSKFICILCFVIFIAVIYLAVSMARQGCDTAIFTYIIPSVAGITGASLIFYLNKAKAENLSKQRIRYVLMKLLLENKIDGDSYAEICSEIDNIDVIMNDKINNMLIDSVNKDVDIENC